jgi:type IV pilus assembly protein PilN
MPKINLLAEGKRPVVARKSRAPLVPTGGGDLGNYLLVAGVVLGVLVFVGWLLLLNHRISAKNEEIRIAQKEVDELQQVIKEVEQYKAKKAELERKIQVINDLKENQRGPVQIMDEVSKAVPELLWLTGMDVTNNSILVRGSAFNMSAVANFIDNLDRVEAFQEPVLQDTTQRPGRGVRTEVYDFRLVFGYSFKKPQPAAAEGAAPAAAAPAAAPVR